MAIYPTTDFTDIYDPLAEARAEAERDVSVLDAELAELSPSVREFTSELIKDFISEHKSKVAKYLDMYDLYMGNHPIINRVMEPNKPNNRLVHDYYGQIVDTVVGYFIGKPVIFNVEDESYKEELMRILRNNEIDDLNMELAKESSIKGLSCLLVYQDEFGETQLAQLPPEEVIFIYDSSKSNKLRYALRYFGIRDITTDKITNYVEIYSDVDVSYWIQQDNNGAYVLDYGRGEPVEPHIFGEVPVIGFSNNKEELGDFEKIATLVHDFNKVMSDASNEHEAYRRAYLMLKNMSIDSQSMVRLQQEGIIEVDEDGDAKFITKQIQTDAVNSHLERLDKSIYKFSRVPNLDDEEFAGNLSGVAIKFKLFGLETKCITKERKFIKGLRKLIRLLTVPINITLSGSYDPNDVEIVFTRNIPSNILEQAQIVQTLQGVVDTETLLGLLPFVDDPADVMKKLEEEALTALPEMPIQESGKATVEDEEEKEPGFKEG